MPLSDGRHSFIEKAGTAILEGMYGKIAYTP